MQSNNDYDSLIAQEGAVWGGAARDFANRVPPDWQIMRERPPHNIIYRRQIDALLNSIEPGSRVLEVGCWSGWLSLEMARRGAFVTGIDVAADALEIARDYAAAHPPQGSVEYKLLDINSATLPAATYDLIVGVGVLHHLVEVRHVLEQFRAALKPGGWLFIEDTFERTPRLNTLLCGGLLMILPTHLTYREKWGHLFRLRSAALSHMADSVEAKGLSPFEGYGRHQRADDLIPDYLTVHSMQTNSAFTGYIIQQLRLPPRAITVLGRALNLFDCLAIRLRLLRGLNYTLLAEKPLA